MALDESCAGFTGEDKPLTTAQWSAWALMGDPHSRVPDTLKPLADRIAQAIKQARTK